MYVYATIVSSSEIVGSFWAPYARKQSQNKPAVLNEFPIAPLCFITYKKYSINI